jgi:hypothetical protein
MLFISSPPSVLGLPLFPPLFSLCGLIVSTLWKPTTGSPHTITADSSRTFILDCAESAATSLLECALMAQPLRMPAVSIMP